jgi:hypothetical protein
MVEDTSNLDVKVKAPVFVVEDTSGSEANRTLMLIPADDNNSNSCM